MAISLQCTGCGKQYRLREELAGKRVKCGCGESMTISSAGAEPDDGPGDDLLDESIWDTPIRSAPAEDLVSAKPERNVLESASVERPAPGVVNGPSVPGASLPEAETETTSETVQEASPVERTGRRITVSRRTLTAYLAIGYGAVMTAYLVITLLVGGLRYYRLIHVAMTASIAVGGVLLRKGHAQSSAVIGLGCAGVFVVSGVSDFAAFLSNLATLVSVISVGSLTGETAGQMGAALLSCTILAVKVALVYPIPIYLIRWSLKEERVEEEREERDDLYAIRDRISEEVAEERERERQGR